MMDVRAHITEAKEVESDTRWKDQDIPPKHFPIYKRSYPNKSGWKWRSLRIKGSVNNYMLVLQCNPRKEQWKSTLMFTPNEDTAVPLARFEYHASHRGVHVHTDCDNITLPMNEWKDRLPSASATHRRTATFSEDTFFNQTLKFFRISSIQQELFDAN